MRPSSNRISCYSPFFLGIPNAVNRGTKGMFVTITGLSLVYGDWLRDAQGFIVLESKLEVSDMARATDRDMASAAMVLGHLEA